MHMYTYIYIYIYTHSMLPCVAVCYSFSNDVYSRGSSTRTTQTTYIVIEHILSNACVVYFCIHASSNRTLSIHQHILFTEFSAMHCMRSSRLYKWLQCVAVCCRVLQGVAVCCSVLQCVAVCGSVWQSF